MSTNQLRFWLIGILVILVLAVAGLTTWLALDAARAAHVRDIVVALVGITMIAANALIVFLLAIVALKISGLFAYLQDRLDPLFMRSNEMLERVQHTTDLVTDNIARPAIQVGGFLAGMRRGINQFRRDSKEVLR